MPKKMSAFNTIWDCMFSPRLYKIFRHGRAHHEYESSGFEKLGDHVIKSLSVMWNLGIYTSPFIIGYMYRRSYFVGDSLFTLTKFVTSIGVILAMSFCIRGWGRAQQPKYLRFLNVLQRSRQNMSVEIKRELQMYDFEFYAWPVEFKWIENERERAHTRDEPVRVSNQSVGLIQWVIGLPFQILGYVAVHTFGIRLIYPGSVGLIQTLLSTSLIQGRARLIETFNGQRFKLLTKDDNSIDTMFIDHRDSTSYGNILVICSEGNAGFYEIGIMATPVDAGYSVLGWNHPGFAGSTGRPYPDQEQHAIDVVMQFAINKLGFRAENIMLFGWSIGGYSTSYAAVHYPNIRGVVLDASFDDLMPLALQQMPKTLEPIVKTAIRSYVDLNNSGLLQKYPGPILLIRRTEDEIICTTEADVSTNRGNFLLIKILKQRYPLILGERQVEFLKEYLALTGREQEQFVAKYRSDDDLCLSMLQSYILEHSKSYPLLIGDGISVETKNKIAVYLARKHMVDYKSTHCTPLPIEYLQRPWDVSLDADFVFT